MEFPKCYGFSRLYRRSDIYTVFLRQLGETPNIHHETSMKEMSNNNYNNYYNITFIYIRYYTYVIYYITV